MFYKNPDNSAHSQRLVTGFFEMLTCCSESQASVSLLEPNEKSLDPASRTFHFSAESLQIPLISGSEEPIIMEFPVTCYFSIIGLHTAPGIGCQLWVRNQSSRLMAQNRCGEICLYQLEWPITLLTLCLICIECSLLAIDIVLSGRWRTCIVTCWVCSAVSPDCVQKTYQPQTLRKKSMDPSAHIPAIVECLFLFYFSINKLPPIYEELADVCDKKNADKLPPRQPYDWSLEQLYHSDAYAQWQS